jgi:hypothetical protein
MWQAALFLGRNHIEFGKSSVNAGASKKINFLKKYKEPPEMTTSTQ